MSSEPTKEIVKKLLDKGLLKTGRCLILGASDTGKTTLAKNIAESATSSRGVGLVDADTGQSHLGPPTTVGWAIIKNPEFELSGLSTDGIFFVGSVSPLGHLLQLTCAISRCVQEAAKKAELIIIDTPGLVSGPAACVLWWTVQQILQPELILAVQKKDELAEILSGLKYLQSRIEYAGVSPKVKLKSMQQRQEYRQKEFERYFQRSRLYKIKTSTISIQNTRYNTNEALIRRVVGLKDENGVDKAIGLITALQDEDTLIIRAPELDVSRIRCLVVGDVTVELSDDAI